MFAQAQSSVASRRSVSDANVLKSIPTTSSVLDLNSVCALHYSVDDNKRITTHMRRDIVRHWNQCIPTAFALLSWAIHLTIALGVIYYCRAT